MPVKAHKKKSKKILMEPKLLSENVSLIETLVESIFATQLFAV